MQGVERGDRGPLDAAAVAGDLVPAGSMFAFLASHRAELFPDGEYADLFAPAPLGRPSVPATRMGAVLALQGLHDLSDRETAEAVRFDVRWKVALGLAVDDRGFDPSTLVYWRRRLAASARPYRVNDAVRQVVEATGVLAGRRRRVTDPALLEDAVATQDTITQLVSAVRKVRRVVPGAAEQVAKTCTGHDYSRPGRPKIGWDDPAARQGLVSALVNDANAVVAAVAGTVAEDDEDAAAAVALLALVAGQDVEPAEGSDGTDGRWRITRPQDKGHGTTAPDRVISVTGPQARHARKRARDRTDGYRAHLAAEPGTGIITGEELTMAAGQDNSDAAAARRFLAREHPGTSDPDGEDPGGAGTGSEPLTWYGDSAYSTGELRQAIADAGDTAVIKPRQPRPPAVPGRFTTSDFTPDPEAGTLTCPAGITRPVPPGRTVTFGTACRACPLRDRCTSSPTGRQVTLHPHDQILRTARTRWAASPDLRAGYAATRPVIERIIAWTATRRARRIKLRYRGTARNNAWLKTRTAALNLATLLRHGLRHDGTTWALAT